MRDGTFEVVCISGLTAVNKTEADWATARQSTYEQCLKWFSHTAVAWMDYYAAARPSWDVDYALPALQQHITLICKPIALLIKGLQQHQNENITLTHVNIIDAFVLCVCVLCLQAATPCTSDQVCQWACLCRRHATAIGANLGLCCTSSAIRLIPATRVSWLMAQCYSLVEYHLLCLALCTISEPFCRELVSAKTLEQHHASVNALRACLLHHACCAQKLEVFCHNIAIQNDSSLSVMMQLPWLAADRQSLS